MPDQDKKQSEAFRKAAKELGCDESDDALGKALNRLKLKQEKKEETRKDEKSR